MLLYLKNDFLLNLFREPALTFSDPLRGFRKRPVT